MSVPQEVNSLADTIEALHYIEPVALGTERMTCWECGLLDIDETECATLRAVNEWRDREKGQTRYCSQCADMAADRDRWRDIAEKLAEAARDAPVPRYHFREWRDRLDAALAAYDEAVNK